MTKEPTKRRAILRRILRIVLIVLAVLIVLGLVLASVYYALYTSGRASLLDRDNSIVVPDSLVDSAEQEGKRITYKGETYRYNEAVVSLLFIGIDKTDIQADGGYGKNGQSESFLHRIQRRNGNRFVRLRRKIHEGQREGKGV
jgi:Na+-transporting NADH:ubiquinone oxidoreductase subunit NqrC